MIRASRIPAIMLLLLAGPSMAQSSPDLELVCGRLFDSESGVLRGPHRIRALGGVIQLVEPLAEPAVVPPGAQDLRAFSCVPGLIDLHVHLTERPEDTADLRVMFRRTRAEQRELSAAHAAATLQAGFTTVRNVGAYIRGVDLSLRDAINRGELPGPRMQVSGYYLTVPGGGGDLLVPGVPAEATPHFVRGGIARGPEQFRAKAEQALQDGVDVLKVIASGAVLAFGGVPGAPEMNRDEIAAVVAIAHSRGVRVAAHAHGAQSVRDALLAGVDTIEHASLIDAAGMALARERGAYLVMDVYNGDYIDTEGRAQGWPAEFLRNNLATTELQRVNFSAAVKVGAPIAYGTDAGVYPHGQNARQFRIMVERGMTASQALQSATWHAARAMGWSDRVGVLTPGRFADIVAVRGDVTADIRVLESPSMVIQGGRTVRNASP